MACCALARSLSSGVEIAFQRIGVNNGQRRENEERQNMASVTSKYQALDPSVPPCNRTPTFPFMGRPPRIRIPTTWLRCHEKAELFLSLASPALHSMATVFNDILARDFIAHYCVPCNGDAGERGRTLSSARLVGPICAGRGLGRPTCSSRRPGRRVNVGPSHSLPRHRGWF
jgi:hypothetical protein